MWLKTLLDTCILCISMLVKYVLKIADTIILRGIRVPVWRFTQLYPQIECEIERPCAQIPQFAHAAHDGAHHQWQWARKLCYNPLQSLNVPHAFGPHTASLSSNRGHAEWGCLSPTSFSMLYFGKFCVEWSKLKAGPNTQDWKKFQQHTTSLTLYVHVEQGGL